MIKSLRGRGPWGLLGAALAVLAVEAAVARHDLWLARPEAFDWRLARRNSRTEAPACDVLAFGTSMVQEGLLTRVLESRTGRPAYNLAVCAGRAPFAYYFLRRALRSGARPSAVVLDVHPGFIAENYKAIPVGWSDSLSTADLADMAWTVKDPVFFARWAARKGLPSLNHRHALRAFVTGSFRGEDPAGAALWGNLHHVRNINRNRGSLVAPRDLRYGGAVEAKYKPIWLADPARPVCDAVEEQYLRKFLALAAANGVKVYWLILPVAPELHRARESKGQNAAYDAFVARVAGADPNVVVADARDSAYGADAFLDACHLAPRGAHALSLDLADLMAGPPGAPRRVSLPAYRERPIDAPLEDLAESLKAVMAAAAGVRR